MLFCKLLLSPLPHARVKRIHANAALAMPGVKGILTATDLPAPADTLTDNGTVIKASKWGERGLTNEPLYQGEPILAVAAVDELTAAEAIEKIEIDFERLPFVIDPLDTLRPDGPNPRTDGNVWVTPHSPPGPPEVKELKWTHADFAEFKAGRLPMGKAPDEWRYGDLDAGFKSAALVLDETFVTPDTSHQTLETRSALAYWQNGKVYMHTGTQSTAQTLPAIARWLNIDPDKVVFISEYTGGGFGSKITGGVSLSCYVGGTIGFDVLLVIKPDGRVTFQSGIGNLGTESVSDVHRAGAEVLGVPWGKCDVTWGSTAKNLPFTCVSGGSQTTHAMTRAAHAAAMDARKKLQEIAAKKLGGTPEQYEVANQRVFRKGGGPEMTFAQAATYAIQLGGVYDGHEAPPDVHKLTKASMAALAGQGLVAAAKDNYPRDGTTFSFVASFAEVEVDVETGKYYIVDFLASGDVGTVIHPRALGGQMLGRSTLGIGHAIGQKWVFDPHYGEMVSKRFYQNRPPTILDVPVNMQWTALDIPDPETPVGARGVGEPPVGGGCAAILNALSDALGDEIFQRAPVNADTILTSLEARRPMQHPLIAHI
jgi:CO/xanthine dehydrogenase Mo-binding subunit